MSWRNLLDTTFPEIMTIVSSLEKFHGVKTQHQVDDQLLRQLILQKVDGPGRLLGYRALWRNLQLKYSIRTPPSTVQTLLRELDPEGSRLCQIHRLKRREYLNPGPNYWCTGGTLMGTVS